MVLKELLKSVFAIVLAAFALLHFFLSIGRSAGNRSPGGASKNRRGAAAPEDAFRNAPIEPR